jgi:hypothetical protein|tara:strand:+ start:1780 stop:2001 length:222 start_codon:yes stop_codon:yes gene_type:complete
MVKRGALVKWITAHKSYISNGDVLVGLEPIYKYGVVLKISEKNPSYFVVVCCEDTRWHILDVGYDDFIVLSEG